MTVMGLRRMPITRDWTFTGLTCLEFIASRNPSVECLPANQLEVDRITLRLVFAVEL